MMDLVLIFVTMYWQSYKPTGQCIPHETHDNIWAKLEHHPPRYSHLSKYNTIHLTYDNGEGHPKDHFAPIYFLQRVVFDILFEFLAFVSIVPRYTFSPCHFQEQILPLAWMPPFSHISDRTSCCCLSSSSPLLFAKPPSIKVLLIALPTKAIMATRCNPDESDSAPKKYTNIVITPSIATNSTTNFP